MWSDKLKMVMWIELTLPWEENVTTWYFEKHDKYRNVVNAAEDNGWKVAPLCVEVGARDHINGKWHHMTRALKLDKNEQASQKCSFRYVAVTSCTYVCVVKWCTTKLLG